MPLDLNLCHVVWGETQMLPIVVLGSHSHDVNDDDLLSL